MAEARTDHGEVDHVAAGGGWVVAFAAVGAIAGVLLGLLAAPAASWLIGLFGEAPIVLRIPAAFPPVIAAPVLAVVGLIAGALLGQGWREEVGSVDVTAEDLTWHAAKRSRRFAREEIAEIFHDGGELVIGGDGGVELARAELDDVLVSALGRALRRADYPWLGTGDPREGRYATWVEGDPELPEAVQALLAARRRAREDKRRGEAEELAGQLAGVGVVVRDRRGTQQVRRLD